MNITQSFYKNKYLHKGLEFAANKSPLFVAGTSLALSTVVRPVSILSAPKTDKENKKLACIKSLISSAINFGIMLCVSTPLIMGLSCLEKNPKKFMKEKTVKRFQGDAKNIAASKSYQFASQMLKLGIGLVLASPKAVLNANLLPKFFKEKEISQLNYYDIPNFKRGSKQATGYETELGQTYSQRFLGDISFRGRGEYVAKNVGKILDNGSFQKFSERFKDTNFPMHISALTDTVATATFVSENNRNKNNNIVKERKETLNRNCILSTALSIGAGYVVDKSLDKPTEKFVNGFREANKSIKNLDKCVEGIKIAKPTLIMGGIYYMAIPLISTFFAERTGFNKK